jgi:hypothetical protein
MPAQLWPAGGGSRASANGGSTPSQGDWFRFPYVIPSGLSSLEAAP